MVKLLYDNGVDTSAKNRDEKSSLSLVLEEGHSESEQEALAKVLKTLGTK